MELAQLKIRQASFQAACITAELRPCCVRCCRCAQHDCSQQQACRLHSHASSHNCNRHLLQQRADGHCDVAVQQGPCIWLGTVQGPCGRSPAGRAGVATRRRCGSSRHDQATRHWCASMHAGLAAYADALHGPCFVSSAACSMLSMLVHMVPHSMQEPAVRGNSCWNAERSGCRQCQRCGVRHRCRVRREGCTRGGAH